MDRKSLIITLSLLMGLNSSVLVGYLGIRMPLVRQIFGFFVLTFLPGYLLLDIFKVKVKTLSEWIFFSVAISVSVVMFAGIFINFVYPIVGIKRPLTLGPVLITLDAIILLLLIVQQKTAGFAQGFHVNWRIRVTKWDLFFILLPLMSLLSAYWFSFYGDNRGLLILYSLIAVTPLLFVKVRKFNRTFAIWSIAISLLWSTVFGISWNYLWGYDINGEYYYAHLVLSKGIWSISTYNQYNTIASVNILAPMYSRVLDIGVVPLFKVIYPLLFSLVPVILVRAYEKLLKNRIWAELSVLFFIFLTNFFVNMMALARQMIAELYLALLVYATVERADRRFLILFLASLAVSHYGTAYLTMFALLSLILVRSLKSDARQSVSNTLIAVFWVVTLLWYSTVGGGFQFNNLVNIGDQTLLMLGNLFNPQYSQGLAMVTAKMTAMREIAKWINLTAQGLILLGVLVIIYRLLKDRKVDHLEFYALSFVFFAYDIAGVAVPYFSNRLNATRLYQLTLFFLSPYFIMGMVTIFRVLRRVGTYIWGSFKLNIDGRAVRFVAVFLMVYFLFNSGVMLVVAHDPKPPMWLDKVPGPYWTSAELYGGKWISTYRYDDFEIYSDQAHALIFLGLIGQPINGVSFRGGLRGNIIWNFPHERAYVYFGPSEVVKKEIPVVVWKGSLTETKYIPLSSRSVIDSMLQAQRIYSSTDVMIYKV